MHMSQAGFLSDQETPQPVPERAPDSTAEPSSVEDDAQAIEQLAESPDGFLEEHQAASPTTPVSTSQTTSDATEQTQAKDEVVIAIEKILEDGLGTYVGDLTPDQKEQFTKKGQEVARSIANMVRTLRFQVKKVIGLIHEWLLTIPGVNKFFLEQEAKIKTDRIVAYVTERQADAPPSA